MEKKLSLLYNVTLRRIKSEPLYAMKKVEWTISMSNTTLAIAVGFMLFFAAGTGFILMSDTEEGSNDPLVSVISKVNSNGSGIYCNENLSIDSREGWGGKVFMTPGPGTIQHEMLKVWPSTWVCTLPWTELRRTIQRCIGHRSRPAI